MATVPATEFSKNFGRYRELAQREVVEVTSHDRVTGYFLSPVAYEEYQRLKAMQTEALRVGELPDSALEELATTTMDERHKELNRLMDTEG